MRILISCIGTYGDVHPFIALGRTLAARGHDVRILTCDMFRPQVQRAGLAFSAVLSRQDYLAGIADPDVWRGWSGLRATWQRLWAAVPPGCRELESHLRPGDTVLIGSSLALWSRIIEDKYALPAATVHLSPLSLLSAEAPASGLFPGQSLLPSWALRNLLGLSGRWVVDPLVLPDLNRLRAQLGLAPVRRAALEWLHSPQRVICAFPDWFAAPAGDWPANSVCTGFPQMDPPGAAADADAVDPALAAFLEAGAPPIAFTPGTGMPASGAFFERAVEACARLGRRAVLLTQFPAQLPRPLPPFAFHAHYVDYGWLARRVAVFVHHGGIGTLAQLLACGTPQLITPFAVDQPDNAARAIRLGVARSLAPDARPAAWVDALKELLESPRIRAACAARAALMAACRPGSELIADCVEALRPESAQPAPQPGNLAVV